MAFVGEVPWHCLGTEVPPNVSAARMIKAAHLDWKVRKDPAPGAQLIDPKRTLYDRYLTVRDAVDDEPEPVALGMVGRTYEPLQNVEAFQFFEPLVENDYARFHTAGALGNGERVWVLVQLQDRIVIAGDDVVNRFLLLSNTHDGSGAVTIRFTPVRVVCQNTLSYAMKRSSGVISVRHTRNIAGNLAKAQAAQLRRIIEKVFHDADDLFSRMAMMEMGAVQTERFLEALFPRSEKQVKEGSYPERWYRVDAILNDQRVTPVNTRHTLWALYNAVVRDEDFRASTEKAPDARAQRIWFGSGHELKMRALQQARKMAA